MVAEKTLRDLLHEDGLNKTNQLLLILAVDCDTPKHLSKIRALGKGAGIPEVGNWNISSFLKATNGLAVKLPDGWVLSSKGRKYIQSAFKNLSGQSKPTTVIAAELRKHLGLIKDANTLAFLDEAIRCYEVSPPLYRAGVVLSWVGAMSVLYNYVLRHRLNDFNIEAKKRDLKWKDANSADGLTRMKEHNFLDVIESLGILSKNVKQELQNNCLQLRNSCGHPNNFQVGEHKAAGHLETLIQNVFSRF